MLFSSLEFIFLFLPISVGVYFLLPRRWRNLWIFISGLCFYGFGEPKYLPLMLFTVVADFLFGLWIGRLGEHKKAALAVLWLAVAVNIGQLAFFKYFDFFGFGLPIGISFYTFQALSYVIDVYRKKVSVSRSLVNFGAYVSLFPQLVAGPIVRYSDVERELQSRTHTVDKIASGLRRFCTGLAKKAILANTAGQMWETLATDQSYVGTRLAVLFFAMQIYFDFSGYSDMAIGLGRVFGFEFSENFNYPYVSKSITDFWRRWHISLSTWFREYVYIPLGGNRQGRWATYRNLLITWALTGLWHGATVNFLLWGLYFAVLLIIEKAFLSKLLSKLPRLVGHLYALFFICLGWVIFASDGSVEGLSGAALALRFVGVGCSGFISKPVIYELVRNIAFLLVLCLGATPLPKKLYLKIAERMPKAHALLDIILPLGIFILSVAYVVSSDYNPFLYFRF